MRTATSLPDGLIWRGDILHIDTTVSGRRISRSCRSDSIPEARRLLDTIRGQMRLEELTGVAAPAFKQRIDAREFVHDELARMPLDGSSPRTVVKYTGVMRFFCDFLCRRFRRAAWMHEVDHESVQAFKVHASSTLRRRNGAHQGLGRPASARTVANELDIVRIFLRKAVQRGLLKTNPETGVTRARGAYAARIRWLDDRDIERLLAAANSWDSWAHQHGQCVGTLYAIIIEFYLRTGLRLNELRYLPVSHCLGRDPSGRRILHIGPHPGHTTVCCHVPTAVAAQLQTQGASAVSRRLIAPEVGDDDCARLRYLPDIEIAVIPTSCVWKPKSRPRDVPLSRRTDQLFEQIMDLRRKILLRSPAYVSARHQAHVGEPPWLIPDSSGSPWRFSMQHVMDRCSQHAGITPIVRTHDLRHTFATQLRRRGVPIETIKELLGHADISETLIYAHFTMAEAVRSIDLIDEVGPRS